MTWARLSEGLRRRRAVVLAPTLRESARVLAKTASRTGVPSRAGTVGARVALRSLVVCCALVSCVTTVDEPASDDAGRMPRLLDEFVVYDSGHAAFPAVAQLRNGDILVMFRRGQAHIDPYGRIMEARFRLVGGRMERVGIEEVIDTELDDRDPSVMQTRSGAVLVNFFSGLPTEAGGYRWLTMSVIRSADDGGSWTEAVRVETGQFGEEFGTSDAILELPSGELLMPVWGRVIGDRRISSHAYRSVDGGETWAYAGVVARDPDQAIGFDEPAFALVGDRLVAAFRTDEDAVFGKGFVFFAEAPVVDRRWTPATGSAIWGFPAHLLYLQDGRILMTYGFRQQPFGVRYRVTDAGGLTWVGAWEGILETASETWDTGYPSSVQLSDGSVLTVYYLSQAGRTFVKARRYRVP